MRPSEDPPPNPDPMMVWVPNWLSRKFASELRVVLSRLGSRSVAWARAHRQRWPSFVALGKLSGTR